MLLISVTMSVEVRASNPGFMICAFQFPLELEPFFDVLISSMRIAAFATSGIQVEVLYKGSGALVLQIPGDFEEAKARIKHKVEVGNTRVDMGPMGQVAITEVDIGSALITAQAQVEGLYTVQAPGQS